LDKGLYPPIHQKGNLHKGITLTSIAYTIKSNPGWRKSMETKMDLNKADQPTQILTIRRIMEDVFSKNLSAINDDVPSTSIGKGKFALHRILLLTLWKQFTYHGSNITSSSKKVHTCIGKVWSALKRLSVIWKSDISDNTKKGFFRTTLNQFFFQVTQ